jgi:hypothetical protein
MLLHGQRRIGKSSVLKQVSNFLQSHEFIFVQFDLQHQIKSSLSNIIHNLATAITDQIRTDENQLHISTPQKAELEQNINLFSQVFLPNVYKKIEPKEIVLLIDEFDVVNNDSNNINIGDRENFVSYLEKIINEQQNLFVILVIGTHLHDLPNLPRLFTDVPKQEIDVLDDISAEQIIANPTNGILTYQPKAIQKILQLSGKHPCFIQVICFTLFEKARREDQWIIECTDVEHVSEEAMKKADSFLQSFWQVMTKEERLILSTVAEAEKIAIGLGITVPEHPLYLLRQNGINQTEQLSQAWERLKVKNYLYDEGRKVRVELIRRWLLKYHSFMK